MPVQLRSTCKQRIEEGDVVRVQHGVVEMLQDPFAGRPQKLPITARSSIGQPCLGSGLRSRSVLQREPASDLGAFCGEQLRVLGAGGLLQEEPAILGVQVLEGPVVAERWDRETGKNLLVDGALDEG